MGILKDRKPPAPPPGPPLEMSDSEDELESKRGALFYCEQYGLGGTNRHVSVVQIFNVCPGFTFESNWHLLVSSLYGP